MPQQTAKMRNKYGSASEFLQTFSPDLQITAARYTERAYLGTAPTLAAVLAGYGFSTAEVWICIELENINLFAGVKDKMEVSRQRELSRLILTEYPYLKVTELLLFFHRLKCGRYGRFYGAVDALFIASSLLTFLDERKAEIAHFVSERKACRQKNEVSSGGITYEEYLKMKKQKSDEKK